MTQNYERPMAELDADLEGFFAAARSSRPVPDDTLMARILADANTHMPGKKFSLTSLLRRSLEPVGGYAGVTALTACALFGLGLGYTGSEGIDGLLEPMTLSNSFDVDSAVDLFTFDSDSFDDLEG